MRKIDLIAIGIFVLLFFLVVNPLSPRTYKSTFEKGLPKEYLPSDLGMYGDKFKLHADIGVRSLKMSLAMREEIASIKKLRITDFEKKWLMKKLRVHHEAAYLEFDHKTEALEKEYRAEEKKQKALNKNLE